MVSKAAGAGRSASDGGAIEQHGNEIVQKMQNVNP